MYSICAYVHIHIERSDVKITAATGGCGFVTLRWGAFGNINNEICGISRFNVLLSSKDISKIEITSQIFHNFTGLSDGTLFNVNVVAYNLLDYLITFDYISVKTMVIEGMCM